MRSNYARDPCRPVCHKSFRARYRLDEEGGIWLAAPGRHRCVRVLEGGKITHKVKLENDAYACMLGGINSTTLFIATSTHTRDQGRIEYVEVEIPKAGLP